MGQRRKVATRSTQAERVAERCQAAPEERRSANGTAPRPARDIELAPTRAGEKHRYWCPVCEHAADVRVGSRVNNLGSFSPRCPGGRECLDLIAAELGCRPYQLLEPSTALAHLEPWLTGRGEVRARPETLPAEADVQEWHKALLRNRPKLRHLLRGRGIVRQTVIDYQLGYGSFHGRPAAFTHPVRDADGRLVQLIESYCPELWTDRDGEPRKVRVLTGRGAHLYPFQALQRRDPLGVLIVAEGRWKALSLNQCGFAAVTSTSSTSWNSAWDKYLRNRPVAVLYDVDAEHIARSRADEWRGLGIEAWAVALSSAGYVGKEGVDTALVRDRWSVDRLRAFVLAARERRCA